MFQRKVETYHEEYFDNIENAREYAKDVLLDDGFLILYELKRVGWLYWVPIHMGYKLFT